MTIINSVIIGGGSGDEVEAYALGDAKNAVKDDKVTLNFSADIPLGSEDFLVPANWYSDSYQEPRYAAYVDSEYIYYSTPSNRDYNYAYNKKTGERTTLLSYSSTSQYFISQFGLTSSGTSSSDLKQFIAGKLYNLNLTCYSYYGNTSDGKIAILCAYQNYSYATGYRILMRDAEGFYSEIVYFNPDDVGFPVCLLDSEDKVNYPLICRSKYTGEIITYNINTATKSLDLVGHITKSVFTEEYSDGPESISASLGDITFRFGRTGNFARFKVFRTVKDENGVYDVEFLNDIRQQVIDYLTLLGLSDTYYCCGFVGNILCLQNNGRSVKNGNAFIKVDPDTLTITGYDFAPEANMTLTCLYGNGYSIAYQGLEGSNQKYTVGFMQPIEQPYVATSPQTDRFFANQTLTGIVKENNNGVLKVSTVEDPNNPPPAVPDEAGLKTVINYGGPDGKANYTVVGSPTISGTTVTDFSSSSYVQSNVTVGSSTGTVEYYTAFTIRDISAVEGKSWIPIIDTIPGSVQKGVTLHISSGEKTLNLSTRYNSSTYVDASGHSILEEGIKYFAKAVYDGSTWKTYLSTSGHEGYNPFMPEGEAACSFYPTQQTLTVGRDTVFNGGYNSGSIISVDLAETKVVVNGDVQWVGAEKDFGSVSVGYGYFKNTYFYPLGGQASKDKYVPYDGGMLTEDNISGRKATTMNIILSRNADMGSWTSDTVGYLSAQDNIVLGVTKKLSTPVYLWHDLSYITPVVPETLEPEVVVREDNAQVLQNVTTTGVTVDEHANITGFDGGGKRMAYINSPLYNKSVSSINWWFSFTTGTTVTSYDRMICGFYDSVDSGDVNGFFLKTNNSGRVCLGIGTSSASYWATGYTTLSTSTRYIVNIKYNASSGFTVTVQNGSDGSVVENLTAATTVTTTAQYLVFGCNVAAGGGSYNWNGSIGLGSYYITVDDTTTYFATPYTSVSLPASWKTLDGVIYEYPNGFPETNATELEKGQALPGEASHNLSVQGSLQGLSGSYIVSGFSSGNYLYKNEKWWNTDLTSFEIGLKVSVADAYSNDFYGAYGGSYGPIILGTTASGRLKAYVYTSNSNPVQIQMESSKTFPLDKPFYLKFSYESSTGYKFWYSEDGVEYEQIGASSNVTPPNAGSNSKGFMLGRDYQGGTVSYLRGSLYLKEFYIDVNGVRKYNGVTETISGEAGLYVTKTGGTCGMAISSTSPEGVDSSAVIGTVELDANGAITSYTPKE